MTDEEPQYIDWKKMEWWARTAKRKRELRLKLKYSKRYGKYWEDDL